MKDADIKIVGLSNSKPKSKTNWKVLSAIIGIIVLAVGVIAGIILVRQNQNIQEKASCTAACPNTDGHLINCHGTSDPNGDDQLCNFAGRVEICGQTASDARQFCCPSAGGSWTTNLSSCAVATATATATTSATATATSTTRATTSTSALAQATATAIPLPVTGASWPTILGTGFGIIMILVSLSLAL